MKTKNFLLLSTSVFATSIFFIVFHSQQPQSIQNIVSQTHKHIENFQDNFRDVADQQLVEEAKYYKQLGLDGETEKWHNTSVPAIVTYAYGVAHAPAVGFVRAMGRLPHTVLLYDVGLSSHSLNVISNYCNSTKCVIIDFDLELYPSHVSDFSIHAFRPLIIQHALSRVGGVIFTDCLHRWSDSADALQHIWSKTSGNDGVLVWARRAAVTSLTHPRMLQYLDADVDEFMFVQMVDVTRLMLASTPAVNDIMKKWIQCALNLDCIMPIGAQSVGCKFDKKPQYRYSGCHGQDASALSIILGLHYKFDEGRYTYRERAKPWWQMTPEHAREEFAGLERNNTEDYKTETMSAHTTT